MITLAQAVKAYAAYYEKFDKPIRQAFEQGDRREAVRKIAGA